CQSRRRSKARGMKNSLLKTPPSGPSSTPSPHVPVAKSAAWRRGLVAADAPRKPAVKRNGSAPYAGVPRRAAVGERSDERGDLLVARIRLLEGFVGRSEIADCTQFALQWFGEVLGISQSICLVQPEGEATLFVVGAYGMPGSAITSFTLSLDDWTNPLVAAFA